MAKRKLKATTKTIKILAPVAGKFELPYDVGKTYTISTEQADTLIEAKYAKEVK